MDNPLRQSRQFLKTKWTILLGSEYGGMCECVGPRQFLFSCFVKFSNKQSVQTILSYKDYKGIIIVRKIEKNI